MKSEAMRAVTIGSQLGNWLLRYGQLKVCQRPLDGFECELGIASEFQILQ
jgi:hypothetical protein